MRELIIVAYRCHDEQRARLHDYTSQWWQAAGFEIVEAEGPQQGPFNLSAAFNEAARKAGSWDVALFTGTDMLPEDPAQARYAIERARETGYLVHAATTWGKLGRAATELVLSGEEHPCFESVEQVWPRKMRGLKAITRRLHDEVGGHDERFVGYHGEDLAFNAACQTLAGEEWLPGYCVHLWHDESRLTAERRLIERNQARLEGYYKARRRGPEAMREHLRKVAS